MDGLLNIGAEMEMSEKSQNVQEYSHLRVGLHLHFGLSGESASHHIGFSLAPAAAKTKFQCSETLGDSFFMVWNRFLKNRKIMKIWQKCTLGPAGSQGLECECASKLNMDGETTSIWVNNGWAFEYWCRDWDVRKIQKCASVLSSERRPSFALRAVRGECFAPCKFFLLRLRRRKWNLNAMKPPELHFSWFETGFW